MFIQTPTPEPNILQQIDWRVATPIFTFILGSIVTFIVTFLKDYLDRRREIKNMKTILIQELCYNYGLANQIKSKGAGDSTVSLSYLVDSISIAVYEAYLDRLNSLKASELLNVFLAYQDINEFFNREEKFEALGMKDTSTFGLSPIIFNESIVSCAEKAVNSIKSAILELDPKGGKITLDKYHKLKLAKGSS